MEILKWFVLGAAVFALTLVALMALPPKGPAADEEHVRQQGTFAVVQGGRIVVEEGFRWAHGTAQQSLHSIATIDPGHAEVQLAAELTMDSRGAPHTYRVERDIPDTIGSVALTVGEGKVEFTFELEGQEYAESLAAAKPLVVLDNNIISHWLVLYAQLRAQGTPWQGTAVIPQSLATLPLAVSKPDTAELVTQTARVPVDRYPVLLGDVNVDLFGQGELLLAILYPKQAALAWRRDLFPDGVHIDHVD